METVSIFGWIAASFVLLSFYLSTMVPLRLAAIASNVMFIIYAVLANAPPILVLHCMLFPLNAWRLMEICKLRRKFMGTSAAQMSTVRLLPFMQKSSCERGRILFNSGDIADNVYVILHGQILLQDQEPRRGLLWALQLLTCLVQHQSLVHTTILLSSSRCQAFR